jgi:hypothetical protein
VGKCIAVENFICFQNARFAAVRHPEMPARNPERIEIINVTSYLENPH